MNYREKTEKLEGLRGEVSDFHPFLRELFSRMPEFTRVEYTQGSREFGADFVLESRGSFGDSEYTGVVVKVGTIKQNNTEIDRQIDECFLMPRVFDNGKKEIKIDRVAVVTNTTITKNAQETINKKYIGRTIKFLDNESLVKLIDENYNEYWKDPRIFLNGLLDEQDKISRRMCVGNILDFDSDMNYVDMKIRKKESNSKNVKISDLRSVSSLESALKASNYILIEGSMGGGKSVLIAKHASSIIDKYKKKESNYIPIILEFSNFSDFSTNVIERIQEEIDERILLAKKDVENPSLIVYLDGLDEFNIGLQKRQDFIKDLYQLMIGCQRVKFVVTTRTIEDYDFEVLLDDYFDRYILCPLQHKQIMSIVKSFYNPDNKVGSHLAESSLFNMLPKTPITAILLGQILKSDPKEIPSTLTELYSKFMEIVLSRWDSNNLRSQTEYEVITNICGQFSHYTLQNSLSVISIDELKDMITSYLQERNLKINTEQVFSKISKNNEIFSINYEKNTIKFRHRSFSEFFYAHHIHKNNNYEINQDIYNPYWQNSYFFFFGLVKDSSELLKKLSDITFDNYGLQILQVIANSELLLAAYLTPYSNIKKQVEFSLETAAASVLEMIEDPEQVKHLNSLNMSKFDMLMLVTVIVSKCYNYDFYEKALSDIGEDVLKTKNNFSDVQWLKIFFVTSTLAGRGNNVYIELLAKQYNSKLINLDNDKLKILFNIIYQNDIDMNLEIKTFLRTYQRNFKKGSQTSKVIQSLLKKNKIAS